MALISAVYLLLRRGNAFAADVNPPLRLRRWAAAFFAVSALVHVWWYVFFILDGQPHSASEAMLSAWYAVINVLDCVTMLTTISGTLLSMLQDRRRPVWPVLAAMLPFVALGVVLMLRPSQSLINICFAYLLVVYVAFTIYMIVAVRQYGRWLRDNYADLERKEVSMSYVVALASMLLIIFYSLIDSGVVLFFILHFIELALFVLLLWRVETLPQLNDNSSSSEPVSEPDTPTRNISSGGEAISAIERLLEERCVATRLYLQHDMTLVQLAKALGTNRTYLGQYFSGKGTTYNAYINDLRINHFVALYREAVDAGRPVTAQQLALESGYRSYSTFSAAFKQRKGSSFAAWMREAERK
ncbi:MAG: AraC family transcriptional regulator [Bacteroidales bacterium]|nr:AraC family transcriptional regulator [Bacteroidales bacterium]